MGWGYDPLSAAAKTYYGGIFADHHCLVIASGGGAVAKTGNCLNVADGTSGLPILNINAIELTWTLPAKYNIPNDGTTADLVCKSAV